MARLFIAQLFLALPVIVSTSFLSPRQSCEAASYCSSTSGGSSGSGGVSAADWIGDAAGITGLINAGSYIKRSSIRDRRMTRCVVQVERNAAS